MGLLALAIAPGLAICLFIIYKDRYNAEPLKNLIISFLLGVLSAFPAVIFQILTTKPSEQLFADQSSAIYKAFFAFCIVGFSEEASKYIMVRFYAYRRKAFDEPLDGIVYTVMVGMGFATLENVLYVTEHGVATGVVRMFLSVPAHGTFAVLMGYFIGLAKFNPEKRLQYLVSGLFWAIVFHGAFDFFLFLNDVPLLSIGALVSFIIALRLSRKAINKHQETSRINHQNHFNNFN